MSLHKNGGGSENADDQEIIRFFRDRFSVWVFTSCKSLGDVKMQPSRRFKLFLVTLHKTKLKEQNL